jgi:hypothetical protein
LWIFLINFHTSNWHHVYFSVVNRWEKKGKKNEEKIEGPGDLSSTPCCKGALMTMALRRFLDRDFREEL